MQLFIIFVRVTPQFWGNLSSFLRNQTRLGAYTWAEPLAAAFLVVDTMN